MVSLHFLITPADAFVMVVVGICLILVLLLWTADYVLRMVNWTKKLFRMK